MAVLVLEVKVGAAIETPSYVGSGTALAHTVNAGVVTVGVVARGDAKKSFDVIDGVFKKCLLL